MRWNGAGGEAHSADRIRDVIRQVENDIPEDAIVLGKKLYFEPGEALPNLPVPVTVVRPDGRKLGLHDHALMQVAEKMPSAGWPMKPRTSGSAWTCRTWPVAC